MKKKILNKKKKAFTLAETLITLTILGIVAAISIPALINRQQEAANRTKVKKAMTMYEKALNNMIIENDLKSNNAIIAFGAEGGACANTTEYFKKVEEKTPCRFKTADRIWWDITDIENPLIILNDKKKDETVENLQALAKDTNDITTYAMLGRLDETTNAGIVRINDNAFEQANGTADQKAYMAKLYGFINSNNNNNANSNENKYDWQSQWDKFLAGEFNEQCDTNVQYISDCTTCFACTYMGRAFDETGKELTYTSQYAIGFRQYDENGRETKYTYGCQADFTGCTKSQIFEYDGHGNKTAQKNECNAEGTRCSDYSTFTTYTYGQGDTITGKTERSECEDSDSGTGKCKSVTTYGENQEPIFRQYCYDDYNDCQCQRSDGNGNYTYENCSAMSF